MAGGGPARPEDATNRGPSRRRRAGWLLTAAGGAATAALLAGALGTVAIPGTAADIVHAFVPLPADQVATAFGAIRGAPSPAITFTIEIGAMSDGAVITYDQWEDGYEPDPAHPTQPTTQVWGDGNPANGDASVLCGACAGDQLHSGDALALDNALLTPRDPAQVRWDGADSITSTSAFTVTATAHTPDTDHPIAAAAWAPPTTDFGTAFVVPVGEDTKAPQGDAKPFAYTGASIMSAQDGTTVHVDTDGDAKPEQTETLNAGQSLFVNGGLHAGARIDADQPVHVHLMTGADGSAHFFTLAPTDALRPSASAGPSAPGRSTIAYAFNPGTDTITITPSCAGCPDAVEVAAGTGAAIPIPSGEQAQLASDGPPFAAVTVDATSNEPAPAPQTPTSTPAPAPQQAAQGTASLGQIVFRDDNGNGSADAGEGIPGAVVDVLWAGPDGDFGTGDDDTFTSITDASGQWGVDSLNGGAYRVTVEIDTLPEGMANTVDPDGGGDSKSELSLAPGASNLDQNFGYGASTRATAGAGATGTPTSGGTRFAYTGAAVRRSALLGASLVVLGLGLMLVARPRAWWTRLRPVSLRSGR